MKRSIQEEIVSALWALVCLEAYIHEFNTIAWIAGILSIIGLLGAIVFSFQSAIKDRKNGTT